MGVAVDEAGRDERATRIDHGLAVGVEVGPDLDDHPVADAHIRDVGLVTGAIDDSPPLHQHVTHRTSPRSPRRERTGEPPAVAVRPSSVDPSVIGCGGARRGSSAHRD